MVGLFEDTLHSISSWVTGFKRVIFEITIEFLLENPGPLPHWVAQLFEAPSVDLIEVDIVIVWIIHDDRCHEDHEFTDNRVF